MEYERPSTMILSDSDFFRLRNFIYDECGINLTEVKRTMLEGRLTRRLRLLGLPSFREYCTYLTSPEGRQSELTPMIDAVTTNKTDFFREANHFDYLKDHALPTLLEGRRRLTCWSAGCSTGEEPYTLAIVLAEAGAGTSFHASVLATDISTRVLEHAVKAIYESERIAPVPAALKGKYFLRSKDHSRPLVRVVPAIRSFVTFRYLNFMEEFALDEPVEVIFCRNVLIYFDRATQEKVLTKFARSLVPGGYLFVGHSETLFGMDVPFTPCAPTIYRRRG